jgi:hypothetical protein
MTRLYMEDQGTGIHVLVLSGSKLNIQCIFIFNKSSNRSLCIAWNTLNQHDILVSYILSSWKRILIIVLHFQRKLHISYCRKLGIFTLTLVQYHIVFHFFSFKTMLYVSNYKYPSIHLYLGISIRRQGVIIYNWIQVRHNKSLLSIGWSNCINKMMKQKFKIIMYNRQISYLVSILQQTS